MDRLLAIDYGKKRTGLAWTDPMRIFASRLDPVPTADAMTRLETLVHEGPVGELLLGYPIHLNGTAQAMTGEVERFGQRLERAFPQLKLTYWDERYTTKDARQAMIEAGVPKKRRSDKSLIDSMAATILLQDYLQARL